MRLIKLFIMIFAITKMTVAFAQSPSIQVAPDIGKIEKFSEKSRGEGVSSKLSYQKSFCLSLTYTQDAYDLEEILMKEMEKSPYPESFNEFWTSPVCKAQAIHASAPMIFTTADSVGGSEGFPETIHDYFVNERKDPALWVKAINTQSTDGLTFLDYIQYNIQTENYKTPRTMSAALRMASYLCKHGGVYFKYKESKTCSS